MIQPPGTLNWCRAAGLSFGVIFWLSQAPLTPSYLMIYRVFRKSGFTSFFYIGILSGTSKCIDTASYSEASFLVEMDNLQGYR